MRSTCPVASESGRHVLAAFSGGQHVELSGTVVLWQCRPPHLLKELLAAGIGPAWLGMKSNDPGPPDLVPDVDVDALFSSCGRLQPCNRRRNARMPKPPALARGRRYDKCARAAATASCHRSGAWPGPTRTSMRPAREVALPLASRLCAHHRPACQVDQMAGQYLGGRRSRSMWPRHRKTRRDARSGQRPAARHSTAADCARRREMAAQSSPDYGATPPRMAIMRRCTRSQVRSARPWANVAKLHPAPGSPSAQESKDHQLFASHGHLTKRNGGDARLPACCTPGTCRRAGFAVRAMCRRGRQWIGDRRIACLAADGSSRDARTGRSGGWGGYWGAYPPRKQGGLGRRNELRCNSAVAPKRSKETCRNMTTTVPTLTALPSHETAAEITTR